MSFAAGMAAGFAAGIGAGTAIGLSSAADSLRKKMEHNLRNLFSVYDIDIHDGDGGEVEFDRFLSEALYSCDTGPSNRRGLLIGIFIVLGILLLAGAVITFILLNN